MAPIGIQCKIMESRSDQVPNFFFYNDNSVKKNSVSAKSNKIVLILIFKNEFVGIGF